MLSSNFGGGVGLHQLDGFGQGVNRARGPLVQAVMRLACLGMLGSFSTTRRPAMALAGALDDPGPRPRYRWRSGPSRSSSRRSRAAAGAGHLADGLAAGLAGAVDLMPTASFPGSGSPGGLGDEGEALCPDRRVITVGRGGALRHVLGAGVETPCRSPCDVDALLTQRRPDGRRRRGGARSGHLQFPI